MALYLHHGVHQLLALTGALQQQRQQLLAKANALVSILMSYSPRESVSNKKILTSILCLTAKFRSRSA